MQNGDVENRKKEKIREGEQNEQRKKERNENESE